MSEDDVRIGIGIDSSPALKGRDEILAANRQIANSFGEVQEAAQKAGRGMGASIYGDPLAAARAAAAHESLAKGITGLNEAAGQFKGAAADMTAALNKIVQEQARWEQQARTSSQTSRATVTAMETEAQALSRLEERIRSNRKAREEEAKAAAAAAEVHRSYTQAAAQTATGGTPSNAGLLTTAAQAKEATESVQRLTRARKEEEAAAAAEIASADRLVRSYAPLLEAQRRLARDKADFAKIQAAGTLTNEEEAAVSQALEARTKALAAGHDTLAHSAHMASMGMNTLKANLVNAAQLFIVTGGSVATLAGPLTDAAQGMAMMDKEGRNAMLRLAAMALPLVAIAAAGAVVVTRFASINSETRELTASMQAYGAEAGKTAEQVRAVAKAVYEGGSSKEDALDLAKELARRRTLSASVGRDMAMLANDMAAGTGQSTAEAFKAIADIASQGYPAVKKLDEALNFLTADEAKAVRVMAEHGQQTEMLGTAMAALHRRFDGLREKATSPTEKAFHDLGVGWNSFMDAVAQSKPVMDAIASMSGTVTRMAAAVSSTPQQQLGDAQKDLDELYRRRASRDAANASGKTFAVFGSKHTHGPIASKPLI